MAVTKAPEPVTPSPPYRHTPPGRPGSVSSEATVVDALDSPVRIPAGRKAKNAPQFDTLGRKIDALQKVHNVYRSHQQDIPLGLLHAVVVCGDQSAGKSSLLAALTGLPFDVGTGLKTRGATLVYGQNTPGPFSVTVRTFINGTCENSVGKLGEKFSFNTPEAMLKHVQFCVRGLKEHDTKNLGEAPTFNDHLIVIEAQGPQVQSTIVVDLPGLITEFATKDPENRLRPEDPQLARDLLARWISRNDTSILVCTKSDSEPNQAQTLGFAQAFDEKNFRTFTAFTCADRLEIASESAWLPHWQDRKKRSFVVQLMSVVDNKNKTALSLDLIRNREAKLFSQEEWTSIEKLHAKLGSTHLANALAETQLNNIDAGLKQAMALQKKELQKQRDARALLSALPAEPVVNMHKSILDIQESLRTINKSGPGAIQLRNARCQFHVRFEGAQQDVKPFDPPTGCESPTTSSESALWPDSKIFATEDNYPAPKNLESRREVTEKELSDRFQRDPQYHDGTADVLGIVKDLRQPSKETIKKAAELFIADVCRALELAVGASVTEHLGQRPIWESVQSILTDQTSSLLPQLQADVDALIDIEFSQPTNSASRLRYLGLLRSAASYIHNCGSKNSEHECVRAPSPLMLTTFGTLRRHALEAASRLMADLHIMIEHLAISIEQVVKMRIENFIRQSPVTIFAGLKLHNVSREADAGVLKRLGEAQGNREDPAKRQKIEHAASRLEETISVLANIIGDEGDLPF